MRTTPWSVAISFANAAARDARQVSPPSEDDGHLHRTLDWLCRAHDATPDDGVSYGYSMRGGWLPSYRETSGYILTTFLRAADTLGSADLRQRALRIANWLLEVQNHDGSFANPKYGPRGIVFDTGQCLFGLVAALVETGDPRYRAAAIAAGDWLTDVLGSDEKWSRSEHMSTPHVYNTRTAWALLELDQVVRDDRYVAAARRNLDWALDRQTDFGLFEDNAFKAGATPFTHNISYAICGLQESGWLLDDDRYVAAARTASRAVLGLMRPDGRVPGQISPQGTSLASYSCLTGQAQLATVWAKQHFRTGDPALAAASRASLGVVKRHQDRHARDADMRGAVAGSDPVWRRYAPMSFPNWAAKFFVDGLLLERDLPAGDTTGGVA